MTSDIVPLDIVAALGTVVCGVVFHRAVRAPRLARRARTETPVPVRHQHISRGARVAGPGGAGTVTPLDGLWLSGRPYVPVPSTLPLTFDDLVSNDGRQQQHHDIPTIFVAGPRTGRGLLPAPGLPMKRLWSCSLCQDGDLPSPSLDGTCAWCGGPRPVMQP